MTYVYLPAYLMMFGPKFILLLIALILFWRDRSLITAIAVLGIAMSAFGTLWGVLNAAVLVPRVGGTGDTDFVPSEPPPSQWTTYYPAVGGLWLGLLAILIHFVRTPRKGAT
jgi:hypothetical protein